VQRVIGGHRRLVDDGSLKGRNTVGNWAPVLAAIIAGLVALAGYLVTQFANRRDRKAKVYAEALAAVREYQELPYRVRRRAASDAATRAALAERISDVMAKLGFYEAWLQIDSPQTGSAYMDLVSRTRRQGRQHLSNAWGGKVLERDAEMIGATAPVAWDIKPELDLCVLVMRRELGFLGFLSRPSTRRLLAELRQDRASHDADQAKGADPALVEESA
jgi:hypothetical protein